MGFQSASCSMYRFVLAEEAPRSVLSRLPDLLREHSFREIEDTAEERGFGWVSYEDMLDTQWEPTSPFKGSFAAFSLRLDPRRIPPAVFKKHYQLALRQMQEQAGQKGQGYVSREQKKELREQVRLRLLSRVLPVPAVFEVAWDLQSGRVYLAAGQEKVRDLFLELFYNTFGLSLEPLSAYRLAREHLSRELWSQMQTYEPVLFV